MVRLYRYHAEGAQAVLRILNRLIKQGHGGPALRGLNPDEVIVGDLHRTVTGSRYYFTEIDQDSSTYRELTLKTLTEFINTAVGNAQDENGHELDIDLIDTIARAMRLPFAYNFGSKTMVKTLRDALMSPAEIRALKTTLPNIELVCNTCKIQFRDREVATFRAENSIEGPRFYCSKCVQPSYKKCSKCDGVHYLTDGTIRGTRPSECSTCSDAAAAGTVDAEPASAPEVAPAEPNPFGPATPSSPVIGERLRQAARRQTNRAAASDTSRARPRNTSTASRRSVVRPEDLMNQAQSAPAASESGTPANSGT